MSISSELQDWISCIMQPDVVMQVNPEISAMKSNQKKSMQQG